MNKYMLMTRTHSSHTCRIYQDTIDAGSMADIAFLLLLFFLVATTIVEEKGLLIQLPPWEEGAATPSAGKVFQILINAGGEIMSDRQKVTSEELESRLKESLFGGTTAFSTKGINRKLSIDLKFDERTSYVSYISVYNAILGAYRDLWKNVALAETGTAFDELPPARQNRIREAYPMKLSESLLRSIYKTESGVHRQAFKPVTQSIEIFQGLR